ncbi:hypothetical protein [Amycolatopsis sp. NPDC057786]|uniref:TY-Chap domain-containing protein n=1 Tax=Amycolatopsis sp. NPDC057786 TaxID=3346250 RepID=UPI003673330C
MSTPEGPSWAEFAVNLGELLYELPPTAKLVMHAEGNRFAQFSAEQDPEYPDLVTDLYAGLVSDKVVDERWRMSPADHENLVAAGWKPPSDGLPDWHRYIYAGSPESCAELARQVATALQTALRVVRPADLVVDGWVDRSARALTVTGLGLGPGKIGESNAHALVHYHLRRERLGGSTKGIKAVRMDTGWMLHYPPGTPAPGEPDDFGDRNFYVSDDHLIERRPLNAVPAEFQADFEQRYRTRNGLSVDAG